MFYLFYNIESIFNTVYYKEEENIKSYVTMAVIYKWYVFELSSNLPIIHFTCWYAPFGVMH